MTEWPSSKPVGDLPVSGDTVSRLWYTAFPTNDADEDSTTGRLLYQLILEVRSLRVVMIACAVLVLAMLSLGIVGGVLLFDR